MSDMNRYHVALASGRDEYQKAVDEDRQLLAAFGMRILVIETGMLCIAVERDVCRKTRVDPWDRIELPMKLWNWLRPILIDALEARATRTGDGDLPDNVLHLLAAK